MLDNISGVSKNHIYATLQQFAAATSFPHLSISEMLLSYLNWPQHDWTAYHLQRWRGEFLHKNSPWLASARWQRERAWDRKSAHVRACRKRAGSPTLSWEYKQDQSRGCAPVSVQGKNFPLVRSQSAHKPKTANEMKPCIHAIRLETNIHVQQQWSKISVLYDTWLSQNAKLYDKE